MAPSLNEFVALHFGLYTEYLGSILAKELKAALKGRELILDIDKYFSLHCLFLLPYTSFQKEG